MGRPLGDIPTSKCDECDKTYNKNGRNPHSSSYCGTECRTRHNARKWRKTKCIKCDKKKICTVISFEGTRNFCHEHLSAFIDGGIKK